MYLCHFSRYNYLYISNLLHFVVLGVAKVKTATFELCCLLM